MPDDSMLRAVRESHRIHDSDLAVSFADPHRDDMPLVYVNDAFCELTGFTREASLGRNCRFLQGADTDADAVTRVREGIERGHLRLTTLANYRDDGTSFDNALLVGPVTDAAGDAALLFGMQWDVTAVPARRDASAPPDWHRERFDRQLRRYEATVARLHARSAELGGEAAGVNLVERVVAMSRPQQYPPPEWVPNWTRADHLIRYLIEPYGRTLGARMRYEGDADILAADVFTTLALAVHELACRTLSLEQARGRAPIVTLRFDTSVRDGEPCHELAWSEGSEAVTAEADGLDGVARTSVEQGMTLTRHLIEHVGGHFDTDVSEGTFEARLSVPNRPHIPS